SLTSRPTPGYAVGFRGVIDGVLAADVLNAADHRFRMPGNPWLVLTSTICPVLRLWLLTRRLVCVGVCHRAADGAGKGKHCRTLRWRRNRIRCIAGNH